MPETITLDFSRVDEIPRDKMSRSRTELPREELARLLPAVNDAAPGQGVSLPQERIEAAKATFIATGGNVAEVARCHDLTPGAVTKLAHEHDWPVYGEGMTSAEKSRKSRLLNLADLLENRLFQLADAMGVEKKDIEDITEKGLQSVYVAPLTQRSSAFSAVFDRYMRVMALLEPELFGNDDDPSNPVAARIRQRNQRDSLGGADGVDRQMAEFAARVAVATVQAREAMQRGQAEVIDVEPERE